MASPSPIILIFPWLLQLLYFPNSLLAYACEQGELRLTYPLNNKQEEVVLLSSFAMQLNFALFSKSALRYTTASSRLFSAFSFTQPSP